MERAMLDQIADYFKRRLAGYPTTLSEDESLVIFAFDFLFRYTCNSSLLLTHGSISWPMVN